jgi:hypothetical protein
MYIVFFVHTYKCYHLSSLLLAALFVVHWMREGRCLINANGAFFNLMRLTTVYSVCVYLFIGVTIQNVSVDV